MPISSGSGGNSTYCLQIGAFLIFTPECIMFMETLLIQMLREETQSISGIALCLFGKISYPK